MTQASTHTAHTPHAIPSSRSAFAARLLSEGITNRFYEHGPHTLHELAVECRDAYDETDGASGLPCLFALASTSLWDDDAARTSGVGPLALALWDWYRTPRREQLEYARRAVVAVVSGPVSAVTGSTAAEVCRTIDDVAALAPIVSSRRRKAHVPMPGDDLDPIDTIRGLGAALATPVAISLDLDRVVGRLITACVSLVDLTHRNVSAGVLREFRGDDQAQAIATLRARSTVAVLLHSICGALTDAADVIADLEGGAA